MRIVTVREVDFLPEFADRFLVFVTCGEQLLTPLVNDLVAVFVFSSTTCFNQDGNGGFTCVQRQATRTAYS